MKKSLVIIFSVIVLLAVYKKQHVRPVDDPKDTPLFQQRLKSSLERFQQVDEFPARQDRMQASRSSGRRPPASRPPVRTRELIVSGRCTRVNLTWVEEKKIDKESIRIKRRAQNEEYFLLKGERIFEREEEGGIRYWASDSELTDGIKYEYLISFKDAKGKEITKGPVPITLTCNQRDREIVAQREKMIKEYYQKRGIDVKDYGAVKPPSYQLSKEIYKIDLGNSPQKGREGASVTLVVFTDFECIYCSTWAETLNTMAKTFPKDVTVIFKNYPLPYHKQAELAATAALAAGEQGKFWEMHDLLFKNRTSLGKEDILGYAKALALDLSKFKNALENQKIKKMIDQDKAQGETSGVQNIPTTFINGRRLVGSPPVSYIKGIIEDILKNKRSS